MQSTRTQQLFDATAASYDRDRARLIPGYADFYAAAVNLVPANADHILDLGAGTGLLSAFLRERFPDARLHLIDSSTPMLAQAERRFAGDQEVLCQTGDYTVARWGSSYDAVVSALSIHHLEDAAKKKLFARVYKALKPGCPFINAEQIAAPTLALEEIAKADWLADVRRLGASEEQIAASLLRQTEDRCATVKDQVDWMDEAGFKAAGCAFQQGRFAVLVGHHA